MEILIILVIAAVALYLYGNKKKSSTKSIKKNEQAKQTASETQGIDEFPYKEKYLLTKNEYIFWKELIKITDKNQWRICPKVGLKDIFDITDKKDYMKYFGKIAQKHIDFIICDSALKPLYAIELDDYSHNKNQESDNFKTRIFEKSTVKLIRIKAQKEYSEEYIKRNMESVIGKTPLNS